MEPATKSYRDAVRQEAASEVIPSSSSGEREPVRELKRKDSPLPELVAASAQHVKHIKFNPTKASPGEVLPDDLYRSSAGFLLSKEPAKVTLNADKIKREIEYFSKRVVIAYFLGGMKKVEVLKSWLAQVSKEIGCNSKIGRVLGKGFFQIISKDELSTENLLMINPHESKWGVCFIQPWAPNFSPSEPALMLIPVWITLKNIPDELLSSARDIAGSLGKVVGKHKSNYDEWDQKFCICVTAGQPFTTQVVVTNPVTLVTATVEVDYNNLPVRCHHCMATSHLIKNCKVLEKTKKRGKVAEPAEGEGPASTSSGVPQEVTGPAATGETASREASPMVVDGSGGQPDEPQKAADQEGVKAGGLTTGVAQPQPNLAAISNSPEDEGTPPLTPNSRPRSSVGKPDREASTAVVSAIQAQQTPPAARVVEVDGVLRVLPMPPKGASSVQWREKSKSREASTARQEEEFSDINEFQEAKNAWRKKKGNRSKEGQEFIPIPSSSEESPRPSIVKRGNNPLIQAAALATEAEKDPVSTKRGRPARTPTPPSMRPPPKRVAKSPKKWVVVGTRGSSQSSSLRSGGSMGEGELPAATASEAPRTLNFEEAGGGVGLKPNFCIGTNSVAAGEATSSRVPTSRKAAPLRRRPAKGDEERPLIFASQASEEEGARLPQAAQPSNSEVSGESAQQPRHMVRNRSRALQSNPEKPSRQGS